jgi:hypothetical protein
MRAYWEIYVLTVKFYRFSILILPDKGKDADKVPFPLAARSKTWIGGRSLAGIAGRRHEYFSVMSTVCCQVEVTASG